MFIIGRKDQNLKKKIKLICLQAMTWAKDSKIVNTE